MYRRALISSNRTFMELKYEYNSLPFMVYRGSNRTFMELKFDI